MLYMRNVCNVTCIKTIKTSLLYCKTSKPCLECIILISQIHTIVNYNGNISVHIFIIFKINRSDVAEFITNVFENFLFHSLSDYKLHNIKIDMNVHLIL